jgi:hypothetical protein
VKYFCLLIAVFSIAAPAQKQKKAPDAQVIETKCRRSEDKVTLDGKVKITSDKPLKGLALEFSFLSAAGEVLTTQKTEVSDDELEKDDEPVFHVETLNPPGSIQYRIKALTAGDRELRLANPGPFAIE